MVNTLGNRFVDEGEDFRNYTYAKFGSAILHQPGGCAFQIFDNQVISWLRIEEYGEGIVKKFIANSIDKLADKLVTEGLEDKHQFCQTLSTFNNAVQLRQQELPLKWDPAVKDALSTQSSRSSLPLPKSNWALPITEPPFMAVKVTCGVTFTFGGLAIDPDTSAVLSEKTGKPIEGLFCAGDGRRAVLYELSGRVWANGWSRLRPKSRPAIRETGTWDLIDLSYVKDNKFPFISHSEIPGTR